MSAQQKRSKQRVSAAIFAGAAALLVWLGAAFVQASATPPSFSAPQAAPTQMVSN